MCASRRESKKFDAPFLCKQKGAEQMALNSEQDSAFTAVKNGKNIFLTGPAGAGKSHLIRHIVKWAESTGRRVGLTALTGCAALLLGPGAKTLHSWAGIGLGRESADALATSILRTPKAKSRWKRTDMLIIDEISMMAPDLFEKLDSIGKRVRANTRPWGGIQLIVCGDYFQLPPVTKGISGETLVPGRFAFESPVWRASQLAPVVLSKIERQTDPEFQRALNECRLGTPSAETVALLKSRQGLDWKSKLIRPTLLFSRNADVDTINEKNIAALKQPLRVYDAETHIETDPADPTAEVPNGELLERIVQRLDNDANYAPHLELCKGAQVMLLMNKDIDAGLVNGSRGVIVDFRADGIPYVQFLHGDPVAIERNEWASNDFPCVRRHQIPLRVAYAISIHKSQGATLDCALIDIGSSVFEYGQAYVALSRVRNIESLYVWNLDPSKIKAHPTVTHYYESIMDVPEETPEVPGAVATAGFGMELGDEGWRTIVSDWSTTVIGKECLSRVAERSTTITVYPPKADMLNALVYTPLKSVKVVILGQDPYHGEGQAHGLSFSVKDGNALPPSLRNIRKELLADVGLPDSAWPVSNGNLTCWARQGVLLLNAVLSVEAGNPNSHQGFGWEDLTQRLLGTVLAAHADDPIVFLAWGKFAQTLVHKLRLGPNHTVIMSAHPSPLSAHNGFFGSKPFSKANAYLTEKGAAPVNWAVHTMTDEPTSA
jgi:ATP-dependent DNA helicase PIF1